MLRRAHGAGVGGAYGSARSCGDDANLRRWVNGKKNAGYAEAADGTTERVATICGTQRERADVSSALRETVSAEQACAARHTAAAEAYFNALRADGSSQRLKLRAAEDNLTTLQQAQEALEVCATDAAEIGRILGDDPAGEQ